MSRVVVVGGGIIGLMCAYELRRAGDEITVVDRAEPGTGCSWGNVGWIVPSFARPLPAPGVVAASLRWMLSPYSPLYIRPRADPELARWLWQFWRRCDERSYVAGRDALTELAAPAMAALDRLRREGVEFEMHRSGVLFLFLSRTARDDVYRDLGRLTRGAGDAPMRLDRDGVREMEPRLHDEVAGGIFVAPECHLRPESLIAGLVRRLREAGVVIRSYVTVTGVRRRGRRATAMVTSAGEIAGDLFLLAAGAWSGPLVRAMGAPLPIQGGKGYSISIDRPAWRPTHAVYLDEARVAWSPFADQVRIGGTMEFSGLSTAIDHRRVSAIRRAAGRYFRDWPDGIAQTVWAGLRPLTPDGLPVLGRLPGYDNVFVATGHGMLGMTLAAPTALAMAQLLRTGRCEIDLAPFQPDRFRPAAG